MKKIFLHSKKTKPIWCGHPWVFPKAIAKMEGKPNTGELVSVYDDKDRCIGVGVFNHHSLYQVRMLAYSHESFQQDNLDSIIDYRLRHAKQLREHLNLPNQNTTAYRFCNSEGDGLSGLTIDIYHDIAVVSSSAFWVELNKELIQKFLKTTFHFERIIWCSQEKSLKQDGWQDQLEKSNDDFSCVVLEESIAYQINFQHIQKTGLFLDQRENHLRIASLCHGKRVLDLYSYTGGFALHAAKAGARQVTAVDSSMDAIQLAKENAKRNGLDINFICEDVLTLMNHANDYDIVILDPPKLIPSRQHLSRGIQYSRRLHEAIFQQMSANSLLFTCHCSSAMSWELFRETIRQAATHTHRQIQSLGQMGAASDHPTLLAFPEGEYLRAFLLHII